MDSRPTEFQAFANTYVGNFRGSCIIQLNGQAIVILNNGVEINRWPYNCIRQFRAEDETGKFSFVSGRRGPYGVAEYNFMLHSDSLVDLQGALTEFTGAQFSAVAPGSDPEQQPLHPQEPLPPYPPTLPRHATTANSYMTSQPRRTTVGGRNDASQSDFYPDVFNSPPRQPPKLPPRPPDYMHTERHTSQLSISADEATMRVNLRGRTSTSASSLSGSSWDSNSSYSVPQPQPSLPPPRREAKEPSPEAWVAKSTSYEETQLSAQSTSPGAADRASTAPTLPTKKKSGFFHRHKTDSESKSSKKSSKSSLANEAQKSSSDLHSDTSPIHTSDHIKENKTTDSRDSSPKTEDTKVSPNGAKKESPYDHLPAELQGASTNQIAPHSPPLSPAGSDGKRSPSAVDDFTNLDRIPRSSPILQHRPEHAQHLVDSNGFRRNAATVRGRRSPPSLAAKPLKKSNTLSHIGANSIARGRISPPSVPTSIKEDESLYNVPRPSSANDLYKIPRLSPPTARSNGVRNETYDTPRSTQDEGQGSRVTNGLTSDEGLYKVPSSIAASHDGGANFDTYDSPRPQRASTEGDNLYNVPRSSSDGAKQDEQLYNVPRNTGPDSLYNSPRPARSNSPTTTSASSSNNYEPIGANTPRTSTFHSHTLRPARSFESLHGRRISDTRSNTMAGPFSPPGTSTRPRCEYIDIDLQEKEQSKALFPAKNTPLPPLPKPAGPDRIVDSVYEEISETDIAKNRQILLSSQGNTSTSHYTPPQQGGNPAHALYNTLPPTRPVYPERNSPEMTSALEGIAKAKELSEEEGYELCLPAADFLKRIPMGRVSSADSAHPVPVSQATMLMEKYNINIHDSTLRSRPFSESDILDDRSTEGAKLGTSIPTDTLDSQDEYVIVTGPDRRPKPKPYEMPMGVPVPTQPGGVVDALVEEDQYEIMGSAGRANIALGRGSLSKDGHSQYSTPDPSSGESSVPQPQASHHSAGSGAFTRKFSPRQELNMPLNTTTTEESVSAGIDLDAMSPADVTPNGLYSHQPVIRQHSDLSTSSSHSVGVVSEEGEGQSVETLAQDHNKTSVVKIMAGSPLDRTSSTDLKMLTRDFGNFLDERQEAAPAPSTTATDDLPSPTSLTPPVPKRHNYVNCKPGEEEGGIRGRTVSTPGHKNKPPRPLPRNAMQSRGENVA